MKEAYRRINLEMIGELSEAHGTPGYEKEVSRIMKKWLTLVCDEITYDSPSSIAGLQKRSADGSKVMICGHMDEVDFTVREIDEQGYIHMLPVGGWWGHALPSQALYVIAKEDRRYRGVVGSCAPYGLPSEAKEKAIKPLDLFLDMEVDNREEILELGTQIEDMITPDIKLEVMNNPNYLMGRAWDDRLCTALAVSVLYRIQKVAYEANVYAVGTVQEEVGLRGAHTTANLLHPNVAIALDITTALGAPMDKGDVKLGNGVVLSIMDAGTTAHRTLLREMEEICRDLGLSINCDMMTAGGTDADNIHKAYDGIITVTLSIPTRYMHPHHPIIHRRDYVQTVEVIAEFCRRLSQDKISAMGIAIQQRYRKTPLFTKLRTIPTSSYGCAYPMHCEPYNIEIHKSLGMTGRLRNIRSS